MPPACAAVPLHDLARAPTPALLPAPAHLPASLPAPARAAPPSPKRARQYETPTKDVCTDRPHPPYCEVVYINKQVHCATVTTPNSAYYEKARYLTEQEKSTYMKPKEGMVLVHIPSRCKTVAAYRVVGYDSHLHVQCRVYEQKKRRLPILHQWSW